MPVTPCVSSLSEWASGWDREPRRQGQSDQGQSDQGRSDQGQSDQSQSDQSQSDRTNGINASAEHARGCGPSTSKRSPIQRSLRCRQRLTVNARSLRERTFVPGGLFASWPTERRKAKLGGRLARALLCSALSSDALAGSGRCRSCPECNSPTRRHTEAPCRPWPVPIRK